jgi:hypothetical protein
MNMREIQELKKRLKSLIVRFEEIVGRRDEDCRGFLKVGEIALCLEILADHWLEEIGSIDEYSKLEFENMSVGLKVDKRYFFWL